MPAEAERHIRGGIEVAVLLGVSGGFVDAYIFLHVAAVFVADMSGNLIRLESRRDKVFPDDRRCGEFTGMHTNDEPRVKPTK